MNKLKTSIYGREEGIEIIYLPNMVAISPLGILKLMTLAPMECSLSRTCIGTVGSCTKSPNISTKETVQKSK